MQVGPGGGFKKYAADTKASIAHSVDELYGAAVKGLVSELLSLSDTENSSLMRLHL